MKPYLVDDNLIKNILIPPPPQVPPPIPNETIKNNLKKSNFNIKFSVKSMQIFLLLILIIGLLILYERYRNKKKK